MMRMARLIGALLLAGLWLGLPARAGQEPEQGRERKPEPEQKQKVEKEQAPEPKAEPRVGYLLIWGGAREDESAELAALDGDRLRRVARAHGWRLRPGMPRRIRSSGVEGLNPGFVIDVIGACADELRAWQIRRALHPARRGLYYRRIVSADFAASCPRPAAAPALLGKPKLLAAGRELRVELDCEPKTGADPLAAWKPGRAVWLLAAGDSHRARLAAIERGDAACPRLRLVMDAPLTDGVGAVVAVAPSAAAKTWRRQDQRILTDSGLTIRIQSLVVAEDINNCASWEEEVADSPMGEVGDCIEAHREQLSFQARHRGGQGWYTLGARACDGQGMTWSVLGDVDRDGVPELDIHCMSYPDSNLDVVQIFPRIETLHSQWSGVY